MLWRVRDFAPAVLIPAAWAATAGAHAELLDTEAILIAHVVMAVFIAFFVITGWNAMTEGALRAWRVLLVVGFGLTLAGIAGFYVTEFETLLLATSLIGWMVLPAVGLAYTGQALIGGGFHPVYHGGGGLSVIAAGLYAAGFAIGFTPLYFIALAFVGIGQTAGIVAATLHE